MARQSKRFRMSAFRRRRLAAKSARRSRRKRRGVLGAGRYRAAARHLRYVGNRERTHRWRARCAGRGRPAGGADLRCPMRASDTEGGFNAANPVFTRQGALRKWAIVGMNDDTVLGAGEGFRRPGTGCGGRDRDRHQWFSQRAGRIPESRAHRLPSLRSCSMRASMAMTPASRCIIGSRTARRRRR